MAKLSRAAVKEKVAEWVSLGKKAAKIEQAMAKEMEPAQKDFDETTQMIREFYEPKIQTLRDQRYAIENEVTAWLKTQEKDIAIGTNAAVAERETETKTGPRVIDPQKFIVAAKRHGEKLWECVNVGIALAEKLIGKKEVDAISTKPETTSVSCTLKTK